MKITYTADDGTVFDTEKECLEHEGWNSDAYLTWQLWARENGGESVTEYGEKWNTYQQWLDEEPTVMRPGLPWDAIYSTLGLRGVWMCRDIFIEIADALKAAQEVK